MAGPLSTSLALSADQLTLCPSTPTVGELVLVVGTVIASIQVLIYLEMLYRTDLEQNRKNQ